ncbi:MAG TPA: hypothetical protein VFU76_10775 [Terriglobales bacterium]|nr:hypothetical protein [Terriglobales bacterium]
MNRKGRQGAQRVFSSAAFASFAVVFFVIAAQSARAADCIPFDQAKAHIGETRCVSGKVLKVGQSQGGTTFLDFCQNYRKCPFTVVVFRSKLRDVGDVRQLEGKDIEIYGRIKPWGTRAEIILEHVRQLRGEAAHIPPLPKTYDVENRGRFSAGEFSKAKKK